METGVAAGVPYVVLPPRTPRPAAPVVVGWHLMDPPRTETALAAALPLDGLDAWRVYLGLPLTGARAPAGGPEALGYADAVLAMFGPAVFGAADEFPAALAALRPTVGDGPRAVFGGSIGSLVAQEVATRLPVAAIGLVSPVTQLRPVVAANGRRYGVTYDWSPASDEVAARLDFVARSAELAAPTLLVVGEHDSPDGILEPAARLHAALPGSTLVTVPGMEHALADEPGVDPAPQTPHAAAVDRLLVDFLRTALAG